MVNKELIIFL